MFHAVDQSGYPRNQKTRKNLTQRRKGAKVKTEEQIGSPKITKAHLPAHLSDDHPSSICVNLRSSAVRLSYLCAFASLREIFFLFFRVFCAFLRLFVTSPCFVKISVFTNSPGPPNYACPTGCWYQAT